MFYQEFESELEYLVLGTIFDVLAFDEQLFSVFEDSYSFDGRVVVTVVVTNKVNVRIFKNYYTSTMFYCFIYRSFLLINNIIFLIRR